MKATGEAARAKALFLEALELAPGEREPWLERLARAEPALHARVCSLLGAHARGAALEGGGAPLLGAVDADPLAPGERVGEFRLLERIGEGGFGTVWRAEQDEPVRRTVALKVIKAGMDTREVVARFEAERQALALMDHPCIARVYGGGSTDRGRPWFAMELVAGQPITDVCAARGLGVEERLALFLEVCRAVQHAHQKGVIHRDLKPSNVLVGEVDGRLAAKVIDFGIAKALGEPLTDRSLFTRGGQIVGTPAYMSPEQVAGSSDVDTRADVWALGVLLYELLCAATPFAAAAEGGLHELRRAVLEDDPPLPSARLGRAGGDRGHATSVSARRVRGDLDWIVLRCLEKDRERRYASAGQLALDVQRHLDGEPVLAGPPDLLYRLSKLVRRHRAALASLAAIFLLLVAGVVVSTRLALRARRAERSQAAEARQARTELARFQVIAGFLESVLSSVDPEVARDMDKQLLRLVLDEAARRVPETAREPLVEATLRLAIGRAYLSIALYDQAEAELRRALALRDEALGRDDLETLVVAFDLGTLLAHLGRPDEAEPLVLRAVEGSRRLFGPEGEDTLRALGSLATVRRAQGRLEEAEALGRELLELRIRLSGEPSSQTILCLNELGATLDALGRDREAQELYEHALELNRTLHGPDHPDTLAAENNLAGSYLDGGRPEQALDLLLHSLTRKQELYEPDHPSVITALNNVGQALKLLGRLEEAEAIYAEALALSVERFGAGHRQSAILLFNHGAALLAMERLEEAEPELARAAEYAAALSGVPELASAARQALADCRARLARR